MEDPALLLWSQDWMFRGFGKLPHSTRCNWYDFKDEVFWLLPEFGYEIKLDEKTGSYQLVDYTHVTNWWG